MWQKARQGKDTVADHLTKEYGFIKLSFAEQLKLFCEVTYGMQEKDPALLQQVGLRFRLENPRHWIEKVEKIIHNSPNENYVITDVRFENEAEFVKENKGYLWKIQRWIEIFNEQNQEYNYKKYVAGDRDPNHPSESELNDYKFDVVIHNSKTVEHLKSRVDYFYEAILLNNK